MLIQFLKRYPVLQRIIPSRINILLFGILIYLWYHPPAWVSHPQKPAPDIVIHMADGRSMMLSSLRGQVVLINFWATWCPYCVHELPQIQSFYHDWHARGFTVLALSLDDNPQLAVRYFHQAHDDDLPLGMADQATQHAFGGISKVPSSFVVDKNGMIRDAISGQVFYGRLVDLVQPLLAEPMRTVARPASLGHLPI